MKLNPIDCPVDLALADFYGTSMHPRLHPEEIQGLHDSGLTVDENGDTILDCDDSEIPFGWRVIEADDMSLFFPEEIL